MDTAAPYYNFMPALTLPFVHNPVALDYDVVGAGTLYWADDGGQKPLQKIERIHAIGFNGSNLRTIVDSGEGRGWGRGAGGVGGQGWGWGRGQGAAAGGGSSDGDDGDDSDDDDDDDGGGDNDDDGDDDDDSSDVDDDGNGDGNNNDNDDCNDNDDDDDNDDNGDDGNDDMCHMLQISAPNLQFRMCMWAAKLVLTWPVDEIQCSTTTHGP